MDTLLDVALTNAAMAICLALVAAAGARLTRRPAVAHVLWLLVLAKLLTPPVFELAVVPRPVSEPPPAFAAPVPPQAAVGPRPSVAPSPAVSFGTPAPVAPAARSPRSPGLWPWWLGSLAIAALALLRLVRFGLATRRSTPVDEALALRVRRLAAAIGLRRCPEVRWIEGPVPPLVWSPLAAPRIFLPRLLPRSLTSAELDAVLTHELAHVKRRDHWVRPLELSACILYWWHPVVWWAKRSLRRAEELSCDRWVLQVLPGSARAYAEGLLKTMELTARRTPLPALTSGIGSSGPSGSQGFQHIQERLIMIMKHRSDSSPSTRLRLLLAAVAVFALVIFPTWAERAGDEEARHGEQRLEIERQTLELEERYRAIEARELEERHELHQQATRLRIEDAKREAQALADAGEHESAARLRREIARDERRVALDTQRYELERARLAALGEIEVDLRRTMLEAQALAVRGEEAAAETAHHRAEELRQRYEQRELEITQQATQLEQRHRQAQLEALEAERQHLESAGHAEGAERMAHEAARLRIESRHAATEHELRRQQHALEIERRRLEIGRRQEEEAARAALEAQQRELEARYHEVEHLRVRHAVEAEMVSIRTELPLRLRELRRMLAEVDEDGELGAKIDELEAALETALSELGAEPSDDL